MASMTLNKFPTLFLPIVILAIPPIVKSTIGPDETNYLNYGKIFLYEGIYEFVKGHPFTAVLVALIDHFIQSPLRSYQIIYFSFSLMSYFGILAILKELKSSKEIGLLSRIIICLCPGTYFLGLYAVTHIVYAGILAFYILFLLRGMQSHSSNQINKFIISGALGALLYYTRLDGLITVLISILTILVFKPSSVRTKDIIAFLTTFLILILPWHYNLLLMDHFISPIIYGGWQSNVWIDGPAKYLLGSTTRLSFDDIDLINHILIPLGKNTVLFSQYLGSLMLFPIFLWPLVGFGIVSLVQFPKRLVIISIPFLACLPYIVFFVEARYLIPVTLPLTIFCLLGIDSLAEEIQPQYIKLFTAFLLICTNLVFAIGWIN